MDLEIENIIKKRSTLKVTLSAANDIPFTIMLSDYMEEIQRYIDQKHMPSYTSADARRYLKSLSEQEYNDFMNSFIGYVIETKSNLNLKSRLSTMIAKTMVLNGLMPEPVTDTFTFSSTIMKEKINISGRQTNIGLYENVFGKRYMIWVNGFKDNSIEEYINFMLKLFTLSTHWNKN